MSTSGRKLAGCTSSGGRRDEDGQKAAEQLVGLDEHGIARPVLLMAATRRGAARGSARRASLRPLGAYCVHVSHDSIALRAVEGIVRESSNLRRKPRPPALALSRLGDRLASGLRSGHPPFAGDVLQSTPAVVPKTERKRMRGRVSHEGSVARILHYILGIRATEREGFEPSRELAPPTRLAGECLQPLGHLSSAPLACT